MHISGASSHSTDSIKLTQPTNHEQKSAINYKDKHQHQNDSEENKIVLANKNSPNQTEHVHNHDSKNHKTSHNSNDSQFYNRSGEVTTSHNRSSIDFIA